MNLKHELKLSREPQGGLALALAVLTTREALAQRMELDFFRPQGITEPQFNVMRILGGGPPQGYPLAEIRLRLISRNADVVRLVDRLEALGWVQRSPNPEDRRSSLVQLTPEGQARLKAWAPAHGARMRALEGLLEAKEREHLVQLLEKLRVGLRDQEPWG